MSFVQLVIVVVSFFVLYRFVLPWLFPSVVSGSYTVDPAARRKKDKDDEPSQSNNEEAFVVHGGGIGFVSNHRTQAKAQLRRRATESKNNMS